MNPTPAPSAKVGLMPSKSQNNTGVSQKRKLATRKHTTANSSKQNQTQTNRKKQKQTGTTTTTRKTKTNTKTNTVKKKTPDASTEIEASLEFESTEERWVCGVDEVGRGAWAGPVVVCCVNVCLDKIKRPPGVRDSKKMTLAQRERTYHALLAAPGLEYTLVQRSPKYIDEHNILQATLDAMHESITKLKQRPVHVLIDGDKIPRQLQQHDPCVDDIANEKQDQKEEGNSDIVHDEKATTTIMPPQVEAQQKYRSVQAITQGDMKCWAIAAASIIAKVTRDHLMSKLPEANLYGFQRNKGYGSKEHQLALQQHGYCCHHRLSYRPVLVLSKSIKNGDNTNGKTACVDGGGDSENANGDGGTPGKADATSYAADATTVAVDGDDRDTTSSANVEAQARPPAQVAAH